MIFADEGCVFACRGETLVGVLSRAPAPGADGMVVIVGGPQYRAGSHRQFTLLARRAAAAGFSTLRFDYRGMGDSGGAPVGFEGADDDVKAAIDALVARCPSVRRVFLWGLCDGASAALLYLQRTGDARVAGVCILNPWVRSESTLARTQVKHYYTRRFLDAEFWRKLVRGGVDVGGAVRELVSKLRAARGGTAPSGAMTYQARMAHGLRGFGGSTLLVLSGRDLTAKEFLEYVGSHADWADILRSSNLSRRDLDESDHTFSSADWRARVEEWTCAWLAAGDGTPR